MHWVWQTDRHALSKIIARPLTSQASLSVLWLHFQRFAFVECFSSGSFVLNRRCCAWPSRMNCSFPWSATLTLTRRLQGFGFLVNLKQMNNLFQAWYPTIYTIRACQRPIIFCKSGMGETLNERLQQQSVILQDSADPWSSLKQGSRVRQGVSVKLRLLWLGLTDAEDKDCKQHFHHHLRSAFQTLISWQVAWWKMAEEGRSRSALALPIAERHDAKRWNR